MVPNQQLLNAAAPPLVVQPQPLTAPTPLVQPQPVTDENGPAEIYNLSEGDVKVPFYTIKFDGQGNCKNPETQKRMLSEVQQCTDVYVFAHGWNTNEKSAMKQYRNFIQGYINMRNKHKEENRAAHSGKYRSVLVGVIWPSKWFTETKQGRKQLGIHAITEEEEEVNRLRGFGDDDDEDNGVGTKSDRIENLAQHVSEDSRNRFRNILAQKEVLKNDEAAELIELMKPLSRRADGPKDIKPNQLLQRVNDWSKKSDRHFGTSSLMMVDETTADVEDENDDQQQEVEVQAQVQAQVQYRRKYLPMVYANVLTPAADLIQIFSFWEMRIRAQQVGQKGVHDLVQSVLHASNKPRLHLVGHSFGATVLLAAVSAGHKRVWSRRKITTMLLLQPAVENTVFGRNMDGNDDDNSQIDPILVPFRNCCCNIKPQIFREALRRVNHPIVSTYSDQDACLRVAFEVAAGLHALGAYPPSNLQPPKELQIKGTVPFGHPYDFGNALLCQLSMTDKIKNHCDIFNDEVYWLLYNLVKQSKQAAERTKASNVQPTSPSARFRHIVERVMSRRNVW